MLNAIARAARVIPRVSRALHASVSCANELGGGAIVRRAAPAFNADAVLPDGTFSKISSESLKGEYAVLLWYPLDFTFVCPTELTAFSDRASEFHKIGCKVIGISTDSKFSHLAWMNTPRNKGGLGKMEIPLIGDISKTMSHDYGMLVCDADDDMDGVALRGTVILDPTGKVIAIYNHDAAVGRSVDEILRIVQAFKYVAEHGEVCPANWKPGSKTMKDDVKIAQKEYFEKLK